MPKRGDNFRQAGYVPLMGDVVHLNWAPVIGHEMDGPHYGLIVSADLYNHATGMAIAVPITSKTGKLSSFELRVQAGRVTGAAVLSSLRALDYQARDMQFEAKADTAMVTEANRRIRMIFS